jgi:hypothetical protein
MNSNLKVILSFVCFCIIINIQAQKKTHSTRTHINTPEEQLAGFNVPEGFIVELVASEVDGVVNPIDLAFDDAGNLWTQTAKMYPLDPVANIGWQDLLKLMDNPEALLRSTYISYQVKYLHAKQVAFH